MERTEVINQAVGITTLLSDNWYDLHGTRKFRNTRRIAGIVPLARLYHLLLLLPVLFVRCWWKQQDSLKFQ